MKSHMIMNVSFLLGTSVETAVVEAKELVRELDLAYVRFKFNDVTILIGIGADPEKVFEEYKTAKPGSIIIQK